MILTKSKKIQVWHKILKKKNKKIWEYGYRYRTVFSFFDLDKKCTQISSITDLYWSKCRSESGSGILGQYRRDPDPETWSRLESMFFFMTKIKEFFLRLKKRVLSSLILTDLEATISESDEIWHSCWCTCEAAINKILSLSDLPSRS